VNGIAYSAILSGNDNVLGFMNIEISNGNRMKGTRIPVIEIALLTFSAKAPKHIAIVKARISVRNATTARRMQFRGESEEDIKVTLSSTLCGS